VPEDGRGREEKKRKRGKGGRGGVKKKKPITFPERFAVRYKKEGGGGKKKKGKRETMKAPTERDSLPRERNAKKKKRKKKKGRVEPTLFEKKRTSTFFREKERKKSPHVLPLPESRRKKKKGRVSGGNSYRILRLCYSLTARSGGGKEKRGKKGGKGHRERNSPLFCASLTLTICLNSSG